MKKVVTVLTVLILILAASNCPAQGLTVVLDKIKTVEQRLDKADASLKEEIARLDERVAEIGPSGHALSDDAITTLQTEISLLSGELEKIKESLNSYQEEQQVAYAGLFLQVSQLEEQLAAIEVSDKAEKRAEHTSQEEPMIADVERKAEAVEISGWEFSGLEISGFFDVVSNYDEAAFENGNYNLGQAELDLAKSLSDNISVEAAIAYNSDESIFELGAALVNVHLCGQETEGERPLWNLNNCGVIIGQFDVPFGIDLNYYPSIDRKLISAPLAVEQTHCGWNDFGVQYYMDFNIANFVAYWVNGFESIYEIEDPALALSLGLSVGDEIDNTPNDAFGGRLGVTPLPWIEVGGSFALGSNQSHKTEMALWGIDGQFEMAGFNLTGEYISHHKNKSIAEEKDKGFYAQGHYSFGRPFVTLRYGGVKFDSAKSWEERMTAGLGYVLAEGAEVRTEYQVNDEGIKDMLSLQLVVGF